MAFYKPFFYFARGIVRIFTPKKFFIGEEKIKAPAILVCRHKNNSGPISIMQSASIPIRLWVLDKLTERESCIRHYADYTYSVRYGLPKWISNILAWLAGSFSSALMQSLGAIPVHRGAREIMKTFDLTLQSLKNGEVVGLFADIHYDDDSATVSEMYTGFVHIGRMYRKATGKDLPFYPVYTSTKKRTVLVGDAVMLDPKKPFAEEKQRVVRQLQQSLNQLAVQIGDIDQIKTETEQSREETA